MVGISISLTLSLIPSGEWKQRKETLPGTLSTTTDPFLNSLRGMETLASVAGVHGPLYPDPFLNSLRGMETKLVKDTMGYGAILTLSLIPSGEWKLPRGGSAWQRPWCADPFLNSLRGMETPEGGADAPLN